MVYREGVQVSEYVVVHHLPMVIPQHISGRAGEAATSFAAARRDSAMIEYVMSRTQDRPEIVWEGDDGASVQRALYAHSAAYTLFHHKHDQALEKLMPEANPLRDLISDMTVDHLTAVLLTNRHDGDLVRGLALWAQGGAPSRELRRGMSGDTRTVLTLLGDLLSAHVAGKSCNSEVVAQAVRAAQMDAFSRGKPPVVSNAMFYAFRHDVSADEFAETVAAALEVIPSFIIHGEPVTELIQAMFPQKWMRHFYDPRFGFTPDMFASGSVS